MNDIRFPKWIRSSPSLAMASTLAQILANEFTETASSTSVPFRTSDACEQSGKGAWQGRLVSDECVSSSSDGCNVASMGDVGPSEEKSRYPVDQNGVHKGGEVNTGYLRMVERLLELNSKELDSLPSVTAAFTSTVYHPWKAPISPATAISSGSVWLGPTRSSFASTNLNGGSSMSNIGVSPDILHDSRVRILLRLSRLNDILTPNKALQLVISQRTAAAMVSFFAFAVSCRHSGLPADRTKGFFTECSALYTNLLSKLPSLRLCGNVILEDFTASLVVCGLKLREDEEGEREDKEARGGTNDAAASATGTPRIPYSVRSASSSAVVSGAVPLANGSGAATRTPVPLSSVRDKNLGLFGFGHRALDAILVQSIPRDIDKCVHDAVAVGILRGISLTHSQQLFSLGAELVNHMHDLTDAFATSTHRREQSYKRVLSILLEAISCSRVIDYERTNNWITAIIQETYVVRGLFQREELHAHVVTATLTMLIRQYQEIAKGCATKAMELQMMPDFTEGDQLIELVWKALQDPLGSWEDAVSAAERHPLTLFRHNIEVLVEHLLRTELERLRCYYIITSARIAHHSSPVLLSTEADETTPEQHFSLLQLPFEAEREGQQTSKVSPRRTLGAQQGNTRRRSGPPSAAPYVPSPEEESLRVSICGNIIKFLLLPTSIMNALPKTNGAKLLRASLTEVAARVLKVVTAEDFTSCEDILVAAIDNRRHITSAAQRPTTPMSPLPATPSGIQSSEATHASIKLLAGSRRRANFSYTFYRCIEALVDELIQTVLQHQHTEDTAATTVASAAAATEVSLGDVPGEQFSTPPAQANTSDAMIRGTVAAVCIQAMCSANHHIRSYATSEVMDMVVRLSLHHNAPLTTTQIIIPVSASANPEDAREHSKQLRAERLALCFDAMSSILVPTVVDVESSSQAAEAQEEKAGLARSGTTTSNRGESRREGLSRYGQLLCDTYLDSLREHLSHAGEGRTNHTTTITPVMAVAVKAFVDLVLRVHQRLRGMSSMALALVQEAGAGKRNVETRRCAGALGKDRQRLLHAFNAERMSVVLLLRTAIQFMLRVAWPSSGILYQNPLSGEQRPLEKKMTSSVMAPIAFAALSPFLQPLTMLLHLSTLFPVRSLKHLCTHYQGARYITLDDLSTDDQYVFHYYHRMSRMHRVAEIDGNGGPRTPSPEDQMELECWALFRSCWMMFSYYKYTAETLLAVRYGGIAPRESPNSTSVAAVLDRAPILSTQQCTLLRLIAASAAPLLRMCSSDIQQAMADTAVLLRYALSGTRQNAAAAADVFAVSGFVHTSLYKSLKQLCGGHKVFWKQLNTGELMILLCVAELEILRGATGSVAQLPLYRHFEVREFVASASIPEALGHILGTACEYYIHAVHSMLPSVAFHVVRTDLAQLVLLLSFAVGSVRESASKLLMQIVESFPTYAAYSSALPLLWCLLDLLESGTATQIEALCEHVHFAVVPAVSTDPHRAERQRHTLFVVDAAQRWAALLQQRAPLALFETAIKFMVVQEQESGEWTSTQSGRRNAGSQLALLAFQSGLEEAPSNRDHITVPVMHGAAAAGDTVLTDAAQTMLLHGRAQGTLQAASWYASFDQIQSTVLAHLWAATSLSRRALATSVARQLHSNLLRPARALSPRRDYPLSPVLVSGASTVGDENTAAPDERNGLQVPAQAPDRADVAATFSTAVALLVTHNGIPAGRWQLLQYLVQGAVQTFRSDVLYDAILCWKWLLRQNREAYLLPMLQELDTAFVWTAANRLGIFDGYCTSDSGQVQTGEAPVFEDTTGASEHAGIASHTRSLASIDSIAVNTSPHKLLLSFLTDMYVEEGSPLCRTVEVLRHLYLVAAHMMQFTMVLSLRDSMFGETMRCMLVIGSVAQLLREANMQRLRAGLAAIVPFPAIGALRQRWYSALLRWFTKTPPRWYYGRDPERAVEETKVVHSLLRLLEAEENLLTRTTLGFLDFNTSMPLKWDRPVARCWDSLSVVHQSLVVSRLATESGEAGMKKLIAQENQRLLNLLELLRVLVEHEALRLSVWRTPRRTLKIPNTTPSVGWDRLIECADHHNPAVVVAMAYRFSSIPDVRREASRRVVAHPERYMHVVEAVHLYLTEDVLRAGAPKLFLFRSCTIIQALRLLNARYSAYNTVSSYAIRSLLSQRSEMLIFYLPQLLQLLAMDKSGSIEAFLLHTSAKSTMFAHQLLWCLQTEGEGSGLLAKKCQNLEKQIKGTFTPEKEAFYKSEFAFVDLVTSLSGEVMKYDKPQRKKKLRLRLEEDIFNELPKLHHLYLPTNPDFRVTGVIPHTAGAMQSAAKCPILVQFTCVPRNAEDTRLPVDLAVDADDEREKAADDGHGSTPPHTVVKACIFKMGDDCRQDQISLQLIAFMQRILCSVGVPSFLYPYRVVTTGQSSGIIECVPRSKSRNEIGKLVESNLAEFFVQTFGDPESARFRRARENFVKSTAAYSVVSFILNIKDRHNGNIMIDAEGNLVHIDFGFLFDMSPGGDINFESSPFKLTTEMVQLIGKDVKSKSTLQSKTLTRALVDEENYIYFKTLLNRCYLAVREYSHEICIMVELMLDSKLPCFKPKQTVAHLAERLAVDMNEIDAANYMRRRIHEARQNYRTVLYDYYQKVAEGIEM